MIYHSIDDTFTAEPYRTVNTTYWLYHKAKIRGRVYIRDEGIEIEVYAVELLTPNDMVQIHSLVKQINDGRKTLPVEPVTKQL